jgi:hypothetical protein
MNPYSHTHLILAKAPKIYDGEKQPLHQMLLGKVVICLQNLKLDPYLSPCASINSKWIKDINIRPETLKLVSEGVGNTLK